MAFYQAVIEDHVPIKSAKKGTPGIEFTVSIRRKKHQNRWVDVDWIDRRVWLYFAPGADHSYAMKKLAACGHTGGPLSSMDLRGNWCELTSTFETYEGKKREKYDLALPGGFEKSERDDDAALAIDAIMSSEPLPEGITAVDGGPVGPPSGQAPPAEAPAQHEYADDDVIPPDDEVPF